VRVRRRARGLVVLVVLALVAIGCGSDDGSAVDPSETPPTASTVPPPPPPTTDPAAVAVVELFFLRDGALARGQDRFAPGPDLALRALEMLMAGPTEQDAASGLTSGISGRVSLLSFAVEGANVNVDFSRAFETADTQPQVAQVVYTLTQFAGIETVTFLIDGAPNGATGVRPIGRSDVRSDLAPVGG
jgi:hypothetical protein